MKSTILLYLTGLATIGCVSAQTSFFSLSNPTITGIPNAVNARYTYTQADPNRLYDVVVTVLDRNTTSNIFSNPQVDSTTGFLDASNFTGADAFFTPSWNLRDTATVGDFSASASFSFSVFQTGTTLLAPVTLFANTLDNDGAGNGGASSVREQVTYGGSPVFTLVGSGITQVGNQFTATTNTNAPGISNNPAFTIQAVYENTATFNWTATHLVNDLAPVGRNSTRISALQLGFTTVPEPHLPMLGLLSFAVFALRRKRQ